MLTEKKVNVQLLSFILILKTNEKLNSMHGVKIRLVLNFKWFSAIIAILIVRMNYDKLSLFIFTAFYDCS